MQVGNDAELDDALKAIASKCDEETTRECLRMLLKMTERIVNTPTESKYRSIKASSAALTKNVLSISCGSAAMIALGWMLKETSQEERHWLLVEEALPRQESYMKELIESIEALGPKVFLVGIAGPSGCGKSTLARELAIKFDSVVKSIEADCYFVVSQMPKTRWGIDYETPDGIDFAALLYDLQTIVNILKRDAIVPASFRLGTSNALCDRSGTNIVRTEKAGTKINACTTVVIVVEGFLLFHDARVCARLDAHIWIDLDHDTCCDRRRRREDRSEAWFFEWFDEVVWPPFLKYKDTQLFNAPSALHLDGTQTLEVIVDSALAFCQDKMQHGFFSPKTLRTSMPATNSEASAQTIKEAPTPALLGSAELHDALAEICKSGEKDAQRACLQVLVKITSNVAKNPAESKYRKIKASSVLLHNSVSCINGWTAAMTALGWHLDDTSTGERCWLLGEEAARYQESYLEILFGSLESLQ